MSDHLPTLGNFAEAPAEGPGSGRIPGGHYRRSNPWRHLQDVLRRLSGAET